MTHDLRKLEVYLVSGLFMIALVGLVIAHDPGPSAVAVSDPIAAPEFPSALVPVTFIVSMAGAVSVIRKIVES